MNGGTVRTKDGSMQTSLVGTQTGVARKMMFDELTVANKEKSVLVLHLGDLCRCFSGDLQARVEVLVSRTCMGVYGSVGSA